MELKEIYTKINDLLIIKEERKLTNEEQKELNNLIRLRNKLDPDSYELVKLCLLQ
jgi:hypothetical protein